MAFIRDTSFDVALADINDATHLSITTSEITAWASLAAAELGEVAVTVGAPANGAVSGRRVTVPATSGTTVAASGTATSWCLHNNTDTVYAAGSLSASQAVTSGNTFSTAAFDITFPDAA